MVTPLLLTGATGFVGRALARVLIEEGYELHGLARSLPSRAAGGAPVIWHAGDLTEPATLDEACAAVMRRARELGSEPAALVHAAAALGYREQDRAVQRAVNVEGTRALFAAARRHGLGPGVHVSSVVTVAHSPDGTLCDEYAEWNGAELDVEYVTTKRAAEEVALGFAGALGLRIVNPGVVFGPGGEAANSSRFLVALAQGRLGPLAPPGGISVVGVDDVARGVLLALRRGSPGRRYLLVESYLSIRDLSREAARALALLGERAREPRFTVPAPLWPAVVAVARRLERFRDLELATPQALAMLGCRWRLSGERARRELGWQPAPFADVLLETLRGLARGGALSPGLPSGSAAG